MTPEQNPEPLTFTPVKPAPAPPKLVFVPLPTSGQVAALTAENAVLTAEVAALTAQLRAHAAPAPIALGQPYTNATGRLFVLHHQMSCIAYGAVPFQVVGSVDGYLKLVDEAMAAGADGLSCDDGGGTDPNYTASRVNLYAAANQRNRENGWGPGQTGGVVNAKGVGKFSLYETFDFSNTALETPEAIIQVLSPILRDPANLTWNGRPVFSCYQGGGGRSWDSLAAIFQPALAALTVNGVKPYFIYGGEQTNPDGSYCDGSLAALTAWANGCVKPFADAVWQFANGSCPLGSQSGLPAAETLSQAVHAAGLAFQASVMPQYGQQNNPGERFVEDHCGGEGLHAQYRSILDVQEPELGFQGCTGTDPGEQSNFLLCNIVPGQPVWVGFPNWDVPGYYKDKSGLIADNDNYLQELKTNQRPVYTSDRIIAAYQAMTGAALAAPTADPRGPLLCQDNDDGPLPGDSYQHAATNRQVIYVTCYLSASGYVRLTQGGQTVMRFAPAGQSFLRLPFVAGPVQIDLLRNNAVVLTMTGEPIVGTAAIANANNYTMWAHN